MSVPALLSSTLCKLSGYLCRRRFSSSVGSTISSARNNNSAVQANTAAGTRMPQRPRGRVVRAVGRGRGSGVIVGSRPLLPASVVPEELINQVIVD